METSVEQKIEETFKQMPKEQYPLAKAYALSEAQEFDNYNADWGNSEYDKIRAYKDLKQNYPEEVVKAVEKMVNDNTYTQSKDENKVYVANIVGILNNIEKKQDQNINQENSNLQTTIEKPKQEEITEPKNIENINNQYNAIVKEMTQIKHFIDYDFYPEVNQFELEEEVNRKIENLSKESDVSIEDISKKLETDVEENFRISTLSNRTKKFELLNNQQQTIEFNPKQELSEKQFTQLNFLKNQVKYLGMGESEKLHEDLENAILSPDKNVDVKVEYNNPDKLMKGNTISFDLHIGKGEQGGVFLNSYTANLTMKNGEERTQSFKVQKENNITAKEAINLLEGRAVKIEHDRVDKETGEISRTESFIKLKLKDEKTEYGNYKYEWYNKGYGVDVDDIMKKSNLVFADDTQRERTKKHLEKGNITEVSFVHDKKEIKGFAVLNPQYKQLNLYDGTMNRLNTNKPLQKPELENNQKNEIVKEQHISRGH